MPSVSTLVEDFGGIDTDRWVNSYGNYSVVGGRGRIATTGGVYSAFESAPEWSFPDGASIRVRVYAAALAGATLEAWTALRILPTSPEGTDFGIMVERVTGNLHVENRVSYSDGGRSSVAYSGTSMAWWQLIRSGSNILAQTAPDSSEGVPGTWTTRRTVAVPAWMSSATTLAIALDAYRNNGTVTNSEFDYINTPAPVAANPAATRNFMAFF